MTLKDPEGGLTAAGRRHFARTQGAKLKPGVRGRADTPEKMRRKGSWAARFYCQNPLPPLVKPNGKPTRLGDVPRNRRADWSTLLDGERVRPFRFIGDASDVIVR